MKKRIEWVDQAKCIGIILVIFGHIGNEGPFNQFLYVFHMPLFFILSGFFSHKEEQEWSFFFKKNLTTIIIPYFFLYIIGTPTGIVSILRHPELYPNVTTFDLLWKPWVGMLLGCENCIIGSSFIMANGPLWFILSLFLIRFFHQITLHISNGNKTIILSCFITITIFSLIKNIQLANIWHFKTALFCYPMYILGFYLNKLYNSQILSKISNKYLKLVSAILCILIIVFALPYTGKQIRYVGPEIHCNLLFAYCLGILGSIGIFLLSSTVPKNKWFIEIGKESLIIMGIHLTVLSIIKLVLLKVGFPALTYTFPNCLLETLLTLFCCTLIAKLLIKQFPNLVGFK